MKKCLVVMLMVLLLSLTLLTITASASDTANGISLTNNPRENISFVLEKNQLTIKNLPDTAAYRSMMVIIVKTNGKVQIEHVLTRMEGGYATLSLENLSNGEYYIELYYYMRANMYNSYIYGDELRFVWNNGSGKFKLSPAFDNNKKIYESGRTDEEILKHYLTPTSTVQSSDSEIVKLAHEITKGISDNYFKALAIHDWVCSNIWYDWDAVGSKNRIDSDALSVLKTRRAICIGYSNLTAALLQAEGIPVKLINGYGRITAVTGEWTQRQLSGKETNHFWNEAYLNGRWVIIDTTWDSGNDYQGGQKSASDGLYFNRYFDPTLEAFSIDHFIIAYSEDIVPLSAVPANLAVNNNRIDTAISYGLVPLTMRGDYTQNMTRTEFCALAVALYESVTGKEINGRTTFSDTSDINVEKMAYLGVVYGVGKNMFAPDRLLNREQAAIMISRLADILGCPLLEGTGDAGDSENVSLWAIEAVGKVRDNNVMDDTRYNEFSPKGELTREQGIVAILQLLEFINKSVV